MNADNMVTFSLKPRNSNLFELPAVYYVFIKRFVKQVIWKNGDFI